jgi:uncharacterized protein DUF5666
MNKKKAEEMKSHVNLGRGGLGPPASGRMSSSGLLSPPGSKARMPRRFAVMVLALSLPGFLAAIGWAGSRPGKSETSGRGGLGSPAGEEFFLISSVDGKKHQIVLKRPTEVTELVRVTDSTVYRDEQGKPLDFKDLRAGDTVYVTLAMQPDGSRIATRIRKGIMTVEELHRRYLKFQ